MIRFIYDSKDLNRIKGMSAKMSRGMEKLEDRSDVLDKIKKRQIGRWKMNFDRQGSIYGRWAPLSPFTIGRRIKGKGTTPLRETDGLYDHFVDMNDKGEVSNDAVNWNFRGRGFGGQRWILGHHGGFEENRGLGGGFSPAPARKLWDFDPRDEDAAERMLDDWVSRILDQYFEVL